MYFDDLSRTPSAIKGESIEYRNCTSNALKELKELEPQLELSAYIIYFDSYTSKLLFFLYLYFLAQIKNKDKCDTFHMLSARITAPLWGKGAHPLYTWDEPL